MIERFDFYGFTVQVSSPSAELVEEVRRDFVCFRLPPGEKQANVEVRMHLSPPPYSELPPVSATLSTPRNVCFRSGKISYIDYFGKALSVYDREKRHCTIYGTDTDMVHEIAYLFILSTVGQNLDSRGIHRIHALGVSYHNRGILLLLSSGGGKSTMALELLRHPDFLLLGEDTPLIDRRGTILPFPLRLGIRPGNAEGIPPEYLRTMRRMEFDPKTLIDIEYFGDRLGEAVKPGFLFVGERNLGEVSEIVPLGRYGALKALLKDMVIGLGIYQGLEFLLERGPWEMLGKGGVVASRLFNGLRLLARVRAYKFVLGRDIERNCQTFIQFIEENCP